MAFKMFRSSKRHSRSHKSHHKKSNNKSHHHHSGAESTSTVDDSQRRSYASERHVDSPRVAARKLLVSLMMDCEQGNDDDSFDRPSRDCPTGAGLKARNVVAPELPTYNDPGNKSLYSDDDMKPLLQQMGDSVDSDLEASSSSDGPPKEIFHDSIIINSKQQQEQPEVKLEEKRTARTPPGTKRNSNSEERSKEFKVLIEKFKSLDDTERDEEIRESPAEKERQNIYDMEWFARMEKATKSPLRRNSADLDTPTTHDDEDSISSHTDGLPDAPNLSESEDIDSISHKESFHSREVSLHSRELRRMRTSDSCQASKHDPLYRQQSYKGEITMSYSDLFEAARKAKPVFEELMKSTFDLVWYGPENSMISRFADIKSRERARDKAELKYSNREPGPALSWLYDIVRGSVLFTTQEAPMRIIEALQIHPDIGVVNIQNKYADDGLEGYKLLNLHLQIDTRLGFQHVCEMQIHVLDVDTLDLEQLDKDKLQDLLEHRMTTKQLERLSYLFSDQLCRYDWAEVVLNALLKAELRRLGHAGHLKDAETYRRLGTILNDHLGRPTEALPMLEKELEILKIHLGIHDMSVAESSAQIGDILHAQGETERALEYYGKAVEILELQQQDKKEEYSWVKDARKDISNLMSTEEEVRESREMYSKSLDKYKMTVEEGLSNLHRAFEEMCNNNQSSEGEKLDQVIQKNNESIDGCQRTLLEQCISIPQCHNLAEVAKAQGTVDEVFELFAKSLIQSYQLRSLQKVGLAGSEAKEAE